MKVLKHEIVDEETDVTVNYHKIRGYYVDLDYNDIRASIMSFVSPKSLRNNKPVGDVVDISIKVEDASAVKDVVEFILANVNRATTSSGNNPFANAEVVEVS